MPAPDRSSFSPFLAAVPAQEPLATVWYSIENNMTRDAERANFLGLGLIRTRLFRGPDVFPHPVHQTIYTPNLRQFAIDWFSGGGADSGRYFIWDFSN